jgi:diguanylate cyclase (GGDEF)-like protein
MQPNPYFFLWFIAQLSLAGALLLALGFHRNRAAQIFTLMLIMSAALDQSIIRHQEGALRFGPLLLVTCTLLPEPRLLSKRNLGLLLVTTLLIAITLAAPEHVFSGLSGAVRWLSFNLSSTKGATVITLMAAMLCLIRWAMSARPMEMGLALVLVIAALTWLAQDHSFYRALGLLVCGGTGILTVLYSSYRMAFIDPLTGLPNRRALDETLMRISGNYALGMIDVDHFKQFNDTYGHESGDVVLREVGRTLRQNAGGKVFRYGGEEFCVVYPSTQAKQAGEHGERARAAVQNAKITVPAPRKRQPTKEKLEKRVSVTISMGCAVRAADRKTPSDVLKAADQAMYRAKHKGRNRVVSL